MLFESQSHIKQLRIRIEQGSDDAGAKDVVPKLDLEATTAFKREMMVRRHQKEALAAMSEDGISALAISSLPTSKPLVPPTVQRSSILKRAKKKLKEFSVLRYGTGKPQSQTSAPSASNAWVLSAANSTAPTSQTEDSSVSSESLNNRFVLLRSYR